VAAKDAALVRAKVKEISAKQKLGVEILLRDDMWQRTEIVSGRDRHQTGERQ
jgi:hypothetical protein